MPLAPPVTTATRGAVEVCAGRWGASLMAMAGTVSHTHCVDPETKRQSAAARRPGQFAATPTRGTSDMTRCLLVDDDREIRIAVAEYLERFGLKVTAVGTGGEMRRAVGGGSFD